MTSPGSHGESTSRDGREEVRTASRVRAGMALDPGPRVHAGMPIPVRQESPCAVKQGASPIEAYPPQWPRIPLDHRGQGRPTRRASARFSRWREYDCSDPPRVRLLSRSPTAEVSATGSFGIGSMLRQRDHAGGRQKAGDARRRYRRSPRRERPHVGAAGGEPGDTDVSRQGTRRSRSRLTCRRNHGQIGVETSGNMGTAMATRRSLEC